MVESYKWIVYEQTTVKGCEMEDGSDTRKYSSKIILVPEHQEDEYNESCADEYGYQDYSYRFESNKIAELTHQQILEIASKWIGSLEIHDVMHNKDEFKKIAEKLKHCIDYLDEEEVEKNKPCMKRGHHDYSKSTICADCGKIKGGG